MHLEIHDLLPVTEIVKEQSAATAITAVFSSLPLGKLALGAFFVVAVVFLATTYDSASFTLASVSTRELHAGENPARWLRVFWACSLGVLPVSLMFIDGGIKVILSTTIVVSVPLLLVGYMMARSLLEQLRQDYPA